MRPHPHIGLSTVTYLFDGSIVHRDSLGVTKEITPGALNLMTAGSGVTHSERTGEAARATGQRLFGIQAWAALPQSHEETPPAFIHHAESELPRITAKANACGSSWARAMASVRRSNFRIPPSMPR